MSTEPYESDPDPHDREWYRRSRDGQLGWKVRRQGEDHIKLDRNAREVIVPFREGEWLPEKERRPLTRQQLAVVALSADSHLCRILGMHAEAKREWLSMRDSERMEWIEYGPDDRKERIDLWEAIMSGMKTHYL